MERIYPLDWDALKAEDLQLIHFADIAMTTRPPDFDFVKDGEHAQTLANVLIERMLTFGGIGLSANQVGLPFRVFVFGNNETATAMFNPTISGASKEHTIMKEGCLSFPGFFLTLSRPTSIVISYQDATGTVLTTQYDSVGARVIQHEYDHMEGLNFTNHASHFKLQHELTKWKKQYRRNMKKFMESKRNIPQPGETNG
jgi:peptide deformylase